MFPVNRVFDSYNWMRGFVDFWNKKGDLTKWDLFNSFKEAVLDNFKGYHVPVIALRARHLARSGLPGVREGKHGWQGARRIRIGHRDVRREGLSAARGLVRHSGACQPGTASRPQPAAAGIQARLQAYGRVCRQEIRHAGEGRQHGLAAGDRTWCTPGNAACECSGSRRKGERVCRRCAPPSSRYWTCHWPHI